MRPLLIILATLTLLSGAPTISHAGPEHKPWLGVVIRTSPQGLRVVRISPGSPAERAGVQLGDIVTHLNGKKLPDLLTFKAKLRTMAPGDRLTLKLNSKTQRTLKLTAPPTPLDVLKQVWMGRRLPNSQLKKVDGTSLQLHELRGKPIVLEFFATWCQGCKVSAQALTRLKQTHGDKLHVFAISDEPIKTLSSWSDFQGHTIVHDTDATLQRALGVQTIPLIVVLDADLRIRKIYEGTQNLASLHTVVPKLLKEP